MPNKCLPPLFALLLTAFIPAIGFAHPMGNFSVNHYSKITLQSEGISVRYIIDLAEIPAYQELQKGNITASASDPAVLRFVADRGAELGHGLTLLLDGKALALQMKTSQVIFPPGAGGLPTMKMGFLYEAQYPAGIDRTHATFRYVDANYPGQAGWKEIIALGPAGSLLKSSVPTTDRSAELSNYPTDLLSSPPQDLQASIEATLPAVAATSSSLAPRNPSVVSTVPLRAVALSPKSTTRNLGIPASPARVTQRQVVAQTSSHQPLDSVVKVVSPSLESAATQSSSAMDLRANQQKTPRSKFTELITTQHLSPWFLFTAAFIAMGLGALHALEPGHGKTIVGAYLVGSRGTARHAVLLGMIVTISHTAGVFALGAITLYASRYIVPEQLYPWLGVLSGIIIAGLGLYMLLRRLSGTATDHTHAPGEAHTDWFFAKKSPGEEMAEDRRISLPRDTSASPVSLTQLFTLGITGGIIPCPAALIVLLSAFALHRVGLGFFLIVAFSLGLAAVLIGFGMMMVYARRFMTHLQIDGPLTKRWLPVASSAFITILGSVLAYQAFATTHFNLHLLSKENLGPVLFLAGLGLILGIRHSTDADHVVAISTIVTKQRSIRNAAFIGSVWGLGHTITIFIVGSLIILFGVKIPARIGLSMEFCVAIMLVVLGILNLTGVLHKLTTRWSKPQAGLIPPTPLQLDTGRQRLFAKTVGRFGIYQFFRPLVIGLVHGLAGSAAVALLVLSTIHSPVWATVYLLVFGAGTMIGMMGMTAAMAVPLSYSGDRFGKLSRYMGVASGMVSLSFGSFLVYQLGIVGGLFTSHPEWTPR
ncbi:MAG TPA: hypothetical protein VGD64_07135 [Acidisarcina sp.]